MSKNDGGPAFPAQEQRNGNGDVLVWGGAGMTLRQYYAGQALAGMLAAFRSEPEYAAPKAVQYADALIAELEK